MPASATRTSTSTPRSRSSAGNRTSSTWRCTILPAIPTRWAAFTRPFVDQSRLASQLRFSRNRRVTEEPLRPSRLEHAQHPVAIVTRVSLSTRTRCFCNASDTVRLMTCKRYRCSTWSTTRPRPIARTPGCGEEIRRHRTATPPDQAFSAPRRRSPSLGQLRLFVPASAARDCVQLNLTTAGMPTFLAGSVPCPGAITSACCSCCCLRSCRHRCC